MPRRRTSGGEAFGTFLTLLCLVFVLMMVAAPVFLILGWLYSYLLFKILSRNLKGDASDFWLDHNEKETFRDVYTKLDDAISQREEAERNGIAAGLSFNKDGRFSARSSLGKKARYIIETLEKRIIALKQEYLRLKSLPKERWQKLFKLTKRVKAFEYSILFWLNGFIISLYLLLKKLGLNINELTFSKESIDTFLHTLGGPGGGPFYVLGGLAIAALFGVTGYMIGSSRGESTTSKISPEPPEVSIANLYEY